MKSRDRLSRSARGALLLVLCSLAVLPACSRQARPSLPDTTPPATVPAVRGLQLELDRIFHDPLHDHALWAAVVQSLPTGEILYELNSTKLVMPASGMKVLTLAAAAVRLGWDFRFVTRLVAGGCVEDGALRGDLIVIGGGDPTIRVRNGSLAPVFETWAAALKAAGIGTIEGRLVGDAGAFEGEGLGAGWAWDYLAYGYAAPSGALQYNQGTAVLTVRAPAVAGEAVAVEIAPPGSGLIVRNLLESVPADGELRLELRRLPGSNALEVRGAVPAGTPAFVRTVSVDDPTTFFLDALRAALEANGVEVRGPAVDIARLPRDDPARAAARDPGARVLITHESPPLTDIGGTLMKVSQNLYADTLLKALGNGATDRGRAAVRDAVAGWGVAPAETIIYDGSGLSRYNYVTASALVKVLRGLWRDPAHAERFAATLPIAGRDGTLSGRLRGTRAEGNARAKTGSISNVRSLSGYVETADGEPLAFAIVANHFSVPQAIVDHSIDLAVERLANFTR